MKLQRKRFRIFHLTVHFPDVCNGQCWLRLKPADRTFIQVSDIGSRIPKTWVFFSFSPGHWQVTVDGVDQLRLDLVSGWNISVVGGSFIHNVIMQALTIPDFLQTPW